MIKRTIGKTLNKVLQIFDLRLVRQSQYLSDSLSFDAVFERLKLKNIKFNTVIDIGASDGCWTRKIRKHFPDSFCYMIEANHFHEQSLIQFVENNKNCAYKLAAAADFVGEINFDDSDPWTGVASHQQDNKNTSRVISTTVDEEVVAEALKGPFLLKLDTHGFEIPIFNGACETLTKTNVIIVETYNYDVTNDSLRFWEMCDFLVQKGFRPIDLMEPMFRPKDKSFWQVDLVFIRAERPEFQSNSYD